MLVMVMLDRRISLLPMLIFVTADLVSTKMAMRRPVSIVLLDVISVLFMALFPFLVADTANTNKSIFFNFGLYLTIFWGNLL